MTYLTAEEQAFALTFDAKAPAVICGVSQGMFSIARHYGGIKLNGQSYTYFAEHDELIRDDVLKAVSKMRQETLAASQGQQRELM